MSSTADEGNRSLSNVGLPSANGALQRLLSRAEEEVVGRSIDESLPAADRRTIADRWRATLARGEGHGGTKLDTRVDPAVLAAQPLPLHRSNRSRLVVLLLGPPQAL